MRAIWRRSLDLWERAKREHASPRQIGVAAGVGALSCCSPVLWTHIPMAVLLASALRVNRVWAAFASQVPSLFGLLRPVIIFTEIEIGHRLRTGRWVEIDVRHVVHEATRLILDWVVGAGVFGVALGLVFGALAYLYARRRVSQIPDVPTATGLPRSASAP
jgi:uncharacterized protein (DUF2062 family)